jgi:hypothetical protein
VLQSKLELSYSVQLFGLPLLVYDNRVRKSLLMAL